MTAPAAPSPPRLAVVLAAGKGTRMRSDLPKVLHRAAGRPLLAYVLDAARAAGCAPIVVVVGHGGEQVRAAFPEPDLAWVEQAEQRGTGHALAQAAPLHPAARRRSALRALGRRAAGRRRRRSSGWRRRPARGWGAMAVAELAGAGRLGRVARARRRRPRGDRRGARRDRRPSSRSRTVNAGLYALPAPAILDYLRAPHRPTTRRASST